MLHIDLIVGFQCILQFFHRIGIPSMPTPTVVFSSEHKFSNDAKSSVVNFPLHVRQSTLRIIQIWHNQLLLARLLFTEEDNWNFEIEIAIQDLTTLSFKQDGTGE